MDKTITDDIIKFVVTENHLKLVKRMNIGYDEYTEFGAPGVSPKRPYGNSDVYGDIAEILDIAPKQGKDETYFTSEQEEYMRKIHIETEKVLQIGVATGSFQTGLYEADRYNRDWRKV
jgi:hypothetical protein